ncbi:hypothetical protein FDECE_3769 [Fusarium decemcellulare]|nr:hypothetical protein FDECE_3769 [Fusarium decemcellulare]
MVLTRKALSMLPALVQLVLAGPATAKSCSDLKLPAFSEFNVLQAQAVEKRNFSPPGAQATINICDLTLSLRHHEADDTVNVEVWLPLDNWNGRFVTTGGSGLAAGLQQSLLQPVLKGYATGFTDGGVTLNNTLDPQTGEWILTKSGEVNEVLLENFAQRSIHELTVIGKAAVKSFYGKGPRYTYFSGCSQGGRQGYYAAEKFPKDFDGIMANAPAIYAGQLAPSEFWPSVVMGNIAAPPQCVFTAYQKDIVKTCDPLDGARDGLISEPEKCHYDTSRLVAKKVECEETGGTTTITKDHAEVVAKILKGPVDAKNRPLWYGNPPGANFSGMANTETVNGTTTPIPFTPAAGWIKYFVAQDPSLDTSRLSFPEFVDLFKKSVKIYTPSLGTSNPDLNPFRKAGGKLLSWHGLADQLITHPGTVRYWHELRKKARSQAELDTFYRMFLAPGVAHCAGGNGPIPKDPFSALVDWVEKGVDPDTLFAETKVDDKSVARNLCPYPRALRYDGKGDVNDADSFSCA